MKKTLFILLFLLNLTAFAKPIIVVSIAPEKTFVEKIAKDMVEVTAMAGVGDSPHSYEPKASQMIAISKADIYFSIGVEFEEAWLDRFKSQNPKLQIVNISDNIAKIAMVEHHHEGEHHEDGHHHEGLDPHTWTAPKNVSVMAHTIYKHLVALDPEHQTFYKTNLDAFVDEIRETDRQIQEALKDVKPQTKFMVFHPSWGYFANAYNLEQVAVEVEGKEPKPKEMITIMDEAKEEKVKVIFTQPEFSDKSAKIIAKETGVSVEKISPLASEWSQNLINMAKAIAKN